MSQYLAVLKKYAQFGGRARRQEYWMFVLINLIITVVLEIVAQAANNTAIALVALAYVVLTVLPALAAVVRRLHDTGRSGGWFFIAFIPFIGGIWLLVLLATAGGQGPNAYGPDPKAA